MPIVFITGSGRRIGKGLALRFARVGWDIAIHYNKSEKSAIDAVHQIKDIGRKAIMVKSDVRDFAQVRESFEKAVEMLGVPDVLINNAGVFPAQTSLEDIDQQQWDDVLGINLRGEFFFSKIFAEYAKENARIINIASLGGIKTWKQRLTYNVSKAGVIQLTKSLAKELAPRIAVNNICPGAIIVEGDPSENDKYLVSEEKIPMKRHGNVDDIFDAVYFFATCSRYITGQILCVDGGFSL